MKVKVSVTVEIDPAVWARTAGCERDEVREDIKTYIANCVHTGAVMLTDEADGKIEVR